MVGMLLGVRGGTFKPFAKLFTANAPSYVAIGDFNNDGHPDIAFTDFIGSTVSVALGKGSAAFSTPQSYAVTLNPASLIVTDVNRCHSTNEWRYQKLLNKAILTTGQQ
jgi:FG-GAP-like repeat